MRNKVIIIFSVAVIVAVVYTYAPEQVHSARIDDLRSKIEERSKDITEIEEEIAQYQKRLIEISREKKTLENTVEELEVSRKRISADINLKQQRINTMDLTIEKLDIEIAESERLMEQNREAVKKVLQNIQRADNRSLVEAILVHNSLSEFWEDVDTLEQFQLTLRNNVEKLAALKEEIEEKKKALEKSKQEVVELKRELVNERDLIVEHKREQARLLAATESRESSYQELLEERRVQKEQFEQELFEFESQLRYEIDPTRIPDAKPGTLDWPLDDIYITQYFGKTVAAKQLYTSGTHNGADFRASQGTPVRAVLPGVVEGIGNTDNQAGCYSYGRWILVRHNNGLSTLYAHLSRIAVEARRDVETGQVIGYSGGTPGTSGAGYSTGPHLHLTLFATQGVRIQRYENSINCKQVEIPLADRRAYLDPLSYLPGR